jgi:hypothetical protein
MVSRWSQMLGIHSRSLAAFRIGLGAVLCADLVLRARDLTAHYSDAGVAPRELVAKQLAGTWRWSVHMLSGSTPPQIALFAVAGIAALALLVGYRTRWAAGLCWLLLVSLHNRNPLVLNGGDVLLRMLLFWSMFLPLGRVWSMDSRGREPPLDRPVLSAATVSILLQLCLMYWLSAYFKLQGIWSAPDGFQRLLAFDCYAKPFAYRLSQHVDWLPWMGHAILGWEVLGPILAFSPVYTHVFRRFVIVGFVLLHIGIELSFTVGLFSYVCLVGWLLFVPGPWWSALAGQGRTDESSSEPLTASRHVNVVVTLLLLYVVVWNVSTMRADWRRRLRPPGITRMADLALVRQKWSMFANPTNRDGWYVVVARLRDGRVVDLLRDGKPADWDSFRKPKYIYRRSPNHRWRKLYRNLSSGRVDAFLAPLARYLAHQWNRSQSASAQVATIELHFMEQIGLPHEQDRFMQRLLYDEDLLTDEDLPASAAVSLSRVDA